MKSDDMEQFLGRNSMHFNFRFVLVIVAEDETVAGPEIVYASHCLHAEVSCHFTSSGNNAIDHMPVH